MSEIDTVTREVLAALRGAVFVEGLASGLLDGDESDCWYVDELRKRWVEGFHRGRKLATMAIENEALKEENEKLVKILRRRREKQSQSAHLGECHDQGYCANETGD